MDEIVVGKRDNLDTYSGQIEHKSKTHISKFQVGQSIKSELGGFKGVIIKITPNASASHTDMYTIRTNEGKREYIAEDFLELDENVVLTQIDGIDTEVTIGQALDESDFEHQFTVGNYVQHAIEGNRFKIIKFLGNTDATGQPLYETVSDDGKKYIISETLLEPYTGKQYGDSQIINVSLAEEGSEITVDKETEIKAKTESILEFLNITSSNDQMVQLENAMKIHKYISQNSSYTSDMMQEKTDYNTNEAYLNELYNGLINRRGVCTTDSIVFKHLLSEIGMNGDVVILESKEGGVHAATLVQLGDESYYFDTTLERTIFEQYSNNPEKFVFCCAALGQQEYNQFYNPVGVLPENLNEDLLPMPKNISQDSVPKIIIQSVGSQIQNLTFDENTLDEELENIVAPINEKDKATSTISKGIRFMREVANEFKEEEK